MVEYQVTIESSKGVAGWVAKVHPKGTSPTKWIFGIHNEDRQAALGKAFNWIRLRQFEEAGND